MPGPNDAATNNRGRSVIDLDTYKNDAFTLFGFELDKVLDDTLVVEYVDTTDDGRDIKRNGLILPSAHIQFAWRIGKVLLAGPNCKEVKVDDYICFPNDKGLNASNLHIKTAAGSRKVKNIVFLNEGRIFGICSPRQEAQDETTFENPLV